MARGSLLGLTLVAYLVAFSGCQFGPEQLSQQEANSRITEHLATVVDSSWAHSLPIQIESITLPSRNDRDVEFVVAEGDSIQLAVTRLRRSNTGWEVVQYKAGMSALIADGWVNTIRNRYSDLLGVADELFSARNEWLASASGRIGDPEEASRSELNRLTRGPDEQALRELLSDTSLTSEIEWRTVSTSLNPGHVLIVYPQTDSTITCRTYLGLSPNLIPADAVPGRVDSTSGQYVCDGRDVVYDADRIRQAVLDRVRSQGGVIRLPAVPKVEP